MTPADLSLPETTAGRLLGWRKVIFAKDQPQYLPLPVLRSNDGTVISRWKPTWRERMLVLLGRDIYLKTLTFNEPLQPVRLTVGLPPEEFL